MTIGELREHLSGLPGDLEVHVEDPGAGRSLRAAHFTRYGACIVLAADADPDADGDACPDCSKPWQEHTPDDACPGWTYAGIPE